MENGYEVSVVITTDTKPSWRAATPWHSRHHGYATATATATAMAQVSSSVDDQSPLPSVFFARCVQLAYVSAPAGGHHGQEQMEAFSVVFIP